MQQTKKQPTKPQVTKQRCLVLEEPRRPHLVGQPLPNKLAVDEVLVQSTHASLKSGTMMATYRADGPFRDNVFDMEKRLFLPAVRPPWPCPLGNMTVGRVVATGVAVTQFRVGDMAYGWLPVANYHVVRAHELFHLEGLTPAQALCIDPAIFALGAVRDAQVSYGDRVLVTGMGAIGAFVVLFLKRCGARVYAASGFANRRRLARACGADEVLDSQALSDIGLEVKRLVPGGVDVAIECAGHYRQLAHALRAVRRGCSVVTVGCYVGSPDFSLGGEFFHNVLNSKASLPAFRFGNSTRGEVPWTYERLRDEVIDSLRSGRLPVPEGLLYPTVPFEKAADAVRLIDEHPERTVKVVIEF